MHVMSVNLFDWDHPPWAGNVPQFEPDRMLESLALRWPEMRVEPGCQYLKEAERADRLRPESTAIVGRRLRLW